jgi:hypothetical protein
VVSVFLQALRVLPLLALVVVAAVLIPGRLEPAGRAAALTVELTETLAAQALLILVVVEVVAEAAPVVRVVPVLLLLSTRTLLPLLLVQVLPLQQLPVAGLRLRRLLLVLTR